MLQSELHLQEPVPSDLHKRNGETFPLHQKPAPGTLHLELRTHGMIVHKDEISLQGLPMSRDPPGAGNSGFREGGAGILPGRCHAHPLPGRLQYWIEQGATNDHETAAELRSLVVTPEDLTATIYQLLGIDSEAMKHDLQDRPLPISSGKPVWEVIA